MTRHLRNNLMKALSKSFNGTEVLERMEYLDNNMVEKDYDHLPVQKAMLNILVHLEELEECVSCNELGHLNEHKQHSSCYNDGL